ncbi:ATP-binding protein [Globicatella sanguinis]
MININALTLNISPERREKAKEYVDFLLYECDEIQQFKEKYGLKDEFLEDNISTLNQFYRTYKANKTIPELYIQNGALYYTEYPLSPDAQRRMVSGKFKKLVNDENTQAFRNANIHEIDMDMGNGKALQFAIEYLSKFSFSEEQQGGWLCGNKGIGKSHLLGAIANELKNKNAEVVFISASTLINEIQNTVRNNSTKFKKKMDYYKNAEILILDDMGTEYLTNWTVQSVLYEILNTRMNKKAKTWFSSNLTQKEYENHVARSINDKMTADRLYTRIEYLAKEIQMSGENLRKVYRL